MDILILILIISIVLIFHKRTFSGFIYTIIVIDLFLRIINFVKINLAKDEFYAILDHLPISIPNIIDKYTNGVLNTILIWLIAIAYIIFEYYSIRILIKKK
ncbi:MAG TPA: hypothetical protein GX747_04625 [Tenericutes bacterium]|nr:hypothetical protein [Mycoplasmatota bacterium]